LSDESKDGALKISSPEELENWLKSLPPEQGRWVAVAVAARAALRVAPLVGRNAERERSFLNLAFVTFFAVASARAATKYPAHASRLDVRRAAHGSADASLSTSIPSANAAAGSASQAAGAAAEAARTTTLTTFYGHASAAADAASRAANSASTFSGAAYNVAGGYDVAGGYAGSAPDVAIWSAVSADATFIVLGGSAQALASEPLWADSETDWSTLHWRLLQDALPREDDWQVWIDWYNRRLEGVSDPEEIELIFATVPDKEREAGPAAANKWINERLEEFRWHPTPNPSDGSPQDLDFSSLATDPPVSSPAWDFFISASTLDEGVAREVAAVLEQAGHTTFAQFKDIAPGNNFVREMQSGLDDSGRTIALYSPEYESSDHCQAEWSAAYNSDPSGKKRKLIPFLLRPTALNSLARQVAYKSLVGLSKEERKAAILNAIAPKPAKRDIAQIRAELAETASPQPALNENEQLDAGPNRVFDKPFVDHELVELPYTQRRRIETILSALPRNAPSFIRSALRSYDKELKERGSQPIIDLLNDFASALEREIEEIKATEPELLGAGNASLFESFLRKHALLATHFPLKNEEKFADIPIDEENVTGEALAQPIKDVAEKMSDVVESGLATENIGKIASNSAQFASDIAPLPPEASASEPGSRRVTLKRRYVLGTLGFLVALYNLLGSTASILATEQGAALFESVRKAIEALSKFLL
jgi:hypothetical protein